ncbi:MAG: CBS domain-containing protein, partial [Candidatus Binatia bacterium]
MSYVKEWMSSPVHVVKPRDSVAHARELLERHRINQLPVRINGPHTSDLRRYVNHSSHPPRLSPLSPFVVYVVPAQWFLPDLPLDRIHPRGGHHVPKDFDRTAYKVLFTRARLHDGSASGVDIVKAAHGRDPLIVAHVDL